MRYIFIALIALLAMPAAMASLNTDLYAYWSFDDDTVTDISGNGHDGTIFGGAAYISSCQIGRCVQINAIGEGINISNLANFDGDVTFAGWIAVSTVNQYYVYANNPGPNTLFSLEQEGATPRTDIMVYDGTAWRNTSASVSTGAWRHLVYLFNSSNNQIHMYVDGVKTGTPVAYDGNVTLQNLYVGAWDTPGNAVQFQGIADDMGIWNRTLTQQEITNLYNNVTPTSGNRLLITASDANSGSSISTFNATFGNGSFYSTTDGNITLINWTNGNYTVTVRSNGYVDASQSFEHINQTTLDFSMTVATGINITFFDEQTNLAIANVTYTLYSNQTGYSVSGNTSSGNLTIDGVSTGLYTLEYDSVGYRGRNYYFYIPLQAANLYNTRLYLLNSSNGDSYLPTVLTEDDNPYDGYFQALRWYGNGDGTGQYRVVETSGVDAQGLAPMFLEFNTASYIFRAIDIVNNEVDASYNTPKQLFNQQETYRVTFETGFFNTFNKLGDLQATEIQYFNTTSQFYQFSWSAKPAAIHNICMQITVIYGTSQNVSTTCSSAESGSLVLGFNSTTNPGLYRVLAFANSTTSVQYALATRTDNFLNRAAFPSGEVYNNAALLVGFFMAVTGAFATLAMPVLGIFLMIGAVGLMGSVVLNILPFGGIFLITMAIIGFFIALLVKK